MLASVRNRHSDGRPRNGRMIGSASSVLLLGFLAGMMTGNALPAATMAWATSVTFAVLMASVLVTKLTNYLTIRSERKASARAITELERRMERLIPRRRVIAHGTHSHHPHNREESESDWIPVTRRSRAKTNYR